MTVFSCTNTVTAGGILALLTSSTQGLTHVFLLSGMQRGLADLLLRFTGSYFMGTPVLNHPSLCSLIGLWGKKWGPPVENKSCSGLWSCVRIYGEAFCVTIAGAVLSHVPVNKSTYKSERGQQAAPSPHPHIGSDLPLPNMFCSEEIRGSHD